MNKPVLIGILFAVAAIFAIVYSSFHVARDRVEVCITFNGQSNCRTASADTKEHAMRSAVANACAEMVSGVTDTIACERTNPTSVKWLAAK